MLLSLSPMHYRKKHALLALPLRFGEGMGESVCCNESPNVSVLRGFVDLLVSIFNFVTWAKHKANTYCKISSNCSHELFQIVCRNVKNKTNLNLALHKLKQDYQNSAAPYPRRYSALSRASV